MKRLLFQMNLVRPNDRNVARLETAVEDTWMVRVKRIDFLPIDSGRDFLESRQEPRWLMPPFLNGSD
jgi:hypothetical protein